MVSNKRLIKYLKYLALVFFGMVLVVVFILLARSPIANNTPPVPIPIAVAAPLSGNGATGGQEIVQSIQLYLDAVNKAGGVNRHPLKLLLFDDKGNADTAKKIAPDITKSKALVLLGHRSSDASIAASSFYQDAHLSAITGTANNEKVTLNKPYYFQMIYTNPTLGNVLSIYAQQVWHFKQANIIYDRESETERSQAEIIKAAFSSKGTVKRVLPLNSTPDKRQESIQQILNELANETEPSILFLTFIKEDLAEDFLVAFKRRGLNIHILGEQALSRGSFAKRFEKYDEEKNNPGFFTNGFYVPSPLLFDSAGADAQEYVNNYQKAYGKMPSYVGAKFYEAAIAAVEALRKSKLQLTSNSVKSDREQVHKALTKLNSRKVALNGLTGPLYFNATRSSDQPVRIAQFQNSNLISAPQEFTIISNPEKLNLPKELQAGNIVQSGDKYFWRQRVVYTGIDLNKISRLDQNKSSFTVDFYLWFRYNGNNDPVNIEFSEAVTNSVNPNDPIYDYKKPLKSQSNNGLNYHLYQVRGEFKNSYDFRDYPFDTQKLTIHFDQTHLSNDRLIYAIDTLGLKLPKSKAAQMKPFKALQLWTLKDVSYFQDTSRSSSTQGDPDLFLSNSQVDYPGFSVSVTLQRKTIVFLTKNLLPLLLLTVLTYCAMYLPYNMFAPRTALPASALLSGIVLLLSFKNQLPEISYTVAFDYMFYTYFCLCLIPIIVTAIGSNLDREGKKQALWYLDLSARIIFPIIIITVATIYAIIYGSRLF